MSRILSFEEFAASKVWQDDLAEFADEGQKGYSYADGTCYIAGPMPDGDFLLTIYNAQWTGDLAYLEGILYEEFYLPEVSNAG